MKELILGIRFLAFLRENVSLHSARRGHSLIWPKGVCAAHQGMVFRVFRLKERIQFHYLAS